MQDTLSHGYSQWKWPSCAKWQGLCEISRPCEEERNGKHAVSRKPIYAYFAMWLQDTSLSQKEIRGRDMYVLFVCLSVFDDVF